MRCYVCNTELIWGGDFDGEDYGSEDYAIVTNLSCPKCQAYVEVYHGNANGEEPEPLELLDYIESKEEENGR